MFQVATLKENKFDDFKNTLLVEQDNALILIDFVKTNDLKKCMKDYFDPDNKKEQLDLNTVDILYTRTHTYQLIHGYEGEENYIGSVFNYKRKPIKGKALIGKVKVEDVNGRILYDQEDITMEDIGLILKDLFIHKGYKITDKLEEILYNNKMVVENNEDILSLPNKDIKAFGIPFRIYYKEGGNVGKTSFLNDIGLYLNKKISEAYIISVVYPQCKCLSLDEKMVRQLIDMIGLADEEELKEFSIEYATANQNQRSDNIYIAFNDFYEKLKKIV
jgi:hypothetical protein